LIDCGYGPENFRSGRRWPWRILQWLIPIPSRQSFLLENYLREQKLAPEREYNLFISHFHPDHVGGLNLFPNAKLIYRNESYKQLSSMTPFQQLHQGFIPGLIPSDFAERATPLNEEHFSVDRLKRYGLKTLDYFKDGSVVCIDFPGHALGHTGYLLQTATGPILYVVDAFWDVRAFAAKRSLPIVSRGTPHDRVAYRRTQDALRLFAKAENLKPIACHCPETQKYVDASH
jgi:glyoxylase-like metal-dependent hydrolase (beta-lactamase superfamily II)